MYNVIATMRKKKMMAELFRCPITVCAAVCAACMSVPPLLLHLFDEAAHLDVVDAVRPDDVDEGEHPGGHDDAHADPDAARGGFADLLRQEGLVGGDQQDETVVHDEQHDGQDDGDRPLAAYKPLEVGGLEHLVRRFCHSFSSSPEGDRGSVVGQFPSASLWARGQSHTPQEPGPLAQREAEWD